MDDYLRPVTTVRPPLGGCSGGIKKDDILCPKCREVAMAPHTIDPCSHLICTRCLLRSEGACPVCGESIIDGKKNQVVDELVHKELGDETYLVRLRALNDELLGFAIEGVASRNPLDMEHLVSGQVHLDIAHLVGPPRLE